MEYDLRDVLGSELIDMKSTLGEETDEMYRENGMDIYTFGMNLSLNETQALLKYAGFAPLYPKQKRDSLLIWGKNHQFSIYQINELLYAENEDTL